MNYFNFNMIRPIRLLFIKNNCNVFLFTQRATFLPKQYSMEFNVFSNSEVIKNEKPHKNVRLKSDELIRYDYLKSIFKGELKNKASNLFEKELFLRNFLKQAVSYNTCDIIKVLKVLAETNNRQVVILKSLCDALLVNKSEYTYWECSDLLYALAKLSYRHEGVITLVGNQLKCKNQNFESAAVVKSLLHSCSELRIRDCELLDKLSKFVINNNVDFDLKISLSLLLSLSFLNFSPTSIDCLIKSISALESTDFIHTKDFINFIWSCVILNKIDILPEKHLTHILSESFHDKLNSGFQKIHMGLKLKLLNINAAVSFMPFYKGPSLRELPHYKVISPLRTKEGVLFQESVRDCLSYIASKGQPINLNVDTGTGFCLDMEIHLDSKNWPNALPRKGTELKLGIVLLNFTDFCTDNSLTGITAFKLNILKNLGHLILTVSFSEYPYKAKLSEKIFYLRNKINNLAKESMNKINVEQKVNQ